MKSRKSRRIFSIFNYSLKERTYIGKNSPERALFTLITPPAPGLTPEVAKASFPDLRLSGPSADIISLRRRDVQGTAQNLPHVLRPSNYLSR